MATMSTSSTTVNTKISVTLEQAQKIISSYRNSDQSLIISSFEEVIDRSQSYTPTIQSYHIELSNASPPTSYILTVSFPPTNIPSDYHPNSLATISHLHGLITSQSSIPLPKLYKLDTSLTLIPYQYLLLSSPPPDSVTLADARASNIFTVEENAHIDLQVGLYLRQLHNMQNDWFGLPLPDGKQPSDPSYSWQESFTLFIETALIELEARFNDELTLDVPFQDIRRYLSRAIGFYLFDDVEVPSLIGFTYSEEDIFVSLPSAPKSNDSRITYFSLPTRALWGDPMLETFFMPPGPSEALVQAYEDGKGPLVMFPRQRTKRIWYSLFLAIVVLLERDTGTGRDLGKWAKEMVCDCVKKLKDAPCY